MKPIYYTDIDYLYTNLAGIVVGRYLGAFVGFFHKRRGRTQYMDQRFPVKY